MKLDLLRRPQIVTHPATLIGIFVFSIFLSMGSSVSATASAPVTAGYRDFHFGPSVNNTPTGEKPESKLWFNDGTWWGVLWDPTAGSFAIYRFDASTQTFASTGILIDARAGSKSDVLWDGQRLYIVSHIFTESPGPVPPPLAARLYRYSYDSILNSYSLDAGFPTNVNSSESETLVLDKDSTGKLWIGWIEGKRVKVNRSQDNDLTWGQPFDLPGQGGPTTSDDICGVVAFQGKIGIMWSNQTDMKVYFAFHVDGTADTLWQAREEALADASLGPVADDHIDLKPSGAPDGTLYSVVKTSLTSLQQPRILVLRRTATGSWSRHVVGTVDDEHSRPLLLLDSDGNRVYVFAESYKYGRRAIYMKDASAGDLLFPSGVGTPFIASSNDLMISNPTSTKQCVNAATGLLVLASDHDTRYYLHNFLDLDAPRIKFFHPASGQAATEVTITGSRFTGATDVTFNGAAASFVVDSDGQIRAVVPAGVGTGTIMVSTTLGTGNSASDFLVVPSPPGPPQVYPNPLRARASVRFELPYSDTVNLTIFDVMGRAVRTLFEGELPSGVHVVSWDALNDAGDRVSSGVYWVRFRAQEFTTTRKLLLTR
jgi:hypothetical protein